MFGEKKVSSFEDVNDLPQKGEVYEQERFEETHRGLKSRHVQLIALGGCIGTGLFVGSGQMLANGGPASLFLSYVVMSFVVWNVMNALGEMTTWMPLAGVSPTRFVQEYVDESLSFATGWNYWYAYAFLVPSEITAASIVIEYWTDKVPTAVWITIVLVVIFVLNMTLVAIFGETEFWFASIKIICILVLLIMGLVITLGGAPDHDRRGFRYWKDGQAFKEYLVTGPSGRLCGFWYCMIKSAFSFIMSPELITICAGETQAPQRNIPKATRRFIYRLLFFYLGSSLIVGMCVSPTDPLLLSNAGGSTASASPFVIAAQNAMIKGAEHYFNASILTSAWSAGNSFLFSGSRVLFSLAKNNEAPRIFKTTNRFGIPYWAVIATTLPSFLGYLTVSSSSATVFNWFVNISTISGFLSWLTVLMAFIQFRKALKLQGIEDTRVFKAPLQPYGCYVAWVLVFIFTITNGFAVFVTEPFSGPDFVAAYITLPLFFVIYIGHKIWTRNWRFAKPVSEIDLVTGLDEVERIERMYPDRVPKNIIQKIWYWIA